MGRHDQTDTANDLGWWLVRGDDLLVMLRRAADGEEPSLIFAECYANAGDAAGLLADEDGI